MQVKLKFSPWVEQGDCILLLCRLMLKLPSSLSGKWLIKYPYRGLISYIKHQSVPKASKLNNLPHSICLRIFEIIFLSNEINRWRWITIHLGLTKSVLRKFSTQPIFPLPWSTCVPLFLVHFSFDFSFFSTCDFFNNEASRLIGLTNSFLFPSSSARVYCCCCCCV